MLLKKYGITKTEINKFVNDYEKIIEEFRNKISISIYNKIIYSDTKNKLSALRNFIKSWSNYCIIFAIMVYYKCE